MSFVNPAFLFGLLALSIPIIIHLFNFRRVKKVYFSNTRLLKNVQQTTTSKLRLRHLLILLSRLLFVFFLVIAFAQPFIPGTEEGLKSENVVVYLDNSMSMSNETEMEIQALDQGIDMVNSLVGLYPEGTRFLFLTNDFGPSSNAFKGGREVTELTTETRATGVIRSVEEVTQRIQRTLSALGSESSEIYLISDFQMTTSGDPQLWISDTLHAWHLVPVTAAVQANVYIDTLFLEAPPVAGAAMVSVVAVLANTGPREVQDLLLQVYVDDTQSATTSVSIPAQGTARVNFDLPVPTSGLAACRLVFEDFPVTFDNEFYFVVQPGKKLSILEIKNDPRPTPVERVYGNRELFTIESFMQSNLDYGVLDRVDFVIINGINELDRSMTLALQNYFDRGGEVLLIPGPNPRIESYQPLISGRWLERADTAYRASLALPDLENPFFESVFESEAKDFNMPVAGRSVYWGADRTALLKYRDGSPFLSKSGRVWHIPVPLNDAWTNFHRHAVFVPVMYRLAASGSDLGGALYHSLDHPVIVLQPDSLMPNPRFKLIREGEELIPDQRVIGREVVIEVPRFTTGNGFYTVLQNEVEEAILAFNIPKRESILETYELQALEAVFKEMNQVKILASGSGDEFVKSLESRYVGQPLWKIALVLALLFLLVEVLLIRFLK